MRRLIPILWSQLAWLLCCSMANASGLFDDDAMLEVELRGPVEATLRDDKNRVERPFVLVVGGKELDVMVRVRGKSRVVTCTFPPLRLKFDDAAGTVFAGQGTLKLVTHCGKSRTYELNVLEEYAAYRILELLTGSAVRTRLLSIRYVDTDKPGKEPLERFGFVLESERKVAERLGGELVHVEGIKLGQIEREQIANVFVAQYLIGNTDYSLVTADRADSCCHNGILVAIAEKLHYVPYDFDRAKIVDPSYAKTQMESRRRKRARQYVGYCMDDLDLEAAIVHVRDAREAIFSELMAIEASSGRELRHARRFLEGFFREAEEPARLRASFDKNCLH